MRKLSKWCVLLFLVLGGSAFAQNNPQVGQAITVGIFSLYPPFIYSPSIGFDVNLMQQICQQQGLQCTFVMRTMDELLTDLKQSHGQLDAAISAISITQKRLQDDLFAGPYYQDTMSFLGNDNTPTTITLLQLKDKKIGAVKSTIFYYYLVSVFGSDDNIKLYDSQDDLLQALQEKKVDAITLDTPVAKYWQMKSACKLKVVSAPIKIPGDEGYGIVVRKNNPALKAHLEQGLAVIKANGEYNRLVNTYLSEPFTTCSS